MKRVFAWFEDFNYFGAGIVALAVCAAIGTVGSTLEAMKKESARIETDGPIMKTEAGKFALDSYYECMKSGPVFGPARTSTACANEVVTAAKTLRGDSFAISVRDALAEKLVGKQ